MPTTSSVVRRANYFGTLSYTGLTPPALSMTPIYRFATNTRTHSGPVPSYRQKIAAGSDATSTLSGTKFNMDVSYGHVVNSFFNTSNNGWTINEEAGAMAEEDFPGFPSLTTLNARNQAIMCAYQKSLRLQQSLLSGVFLGELGQTLRMIRNPAMALRGGLSNYLLHLRRLRGQVRSSDTLLSLAGNLWLEYSFGWKPLINDIQDGAKALAENQNRSPYNANWAYAVCSGSDRGNALDSSSLVSRATYRYRVFRRQFDESKVIARCCVRTYASHPTIGNLKNFGFTPEDFVPTVWNLIPYSFLVDYFTNIGDVLGAWSHRNSLLWWWNTTTIQTRYVTKTCGDYVRTYNPKWDEKLIQDSFTPGSFNASTRNIVRGSEPGPLIPAVEFFHPELGSKKWLNLAALGSQHRALLPFRR